MLPAGSKEVEQLKRMIELLTNNRRNMKKHSILSFSIESLLIILIGTIYYQLVVGLRWIDALYFSVIIFTTVSYGDFSQQTDNGKAV